MRNCHGYEKPRIIAPFFRPFGRPLPGSRTAHDESIDIEPSSTLPGSYRIGSFLLRGSTGKIQGSQKGRTCGPFSYEGVLLGPL